MRILAHGGQVDHHFDHHSPDPDSIQEVRSWRGDGGNGEGYFSCRKDGRWEGRYTTEGNRRSVNGKTKQDATEKLVTTMEQWIRHSLRASNARRSRLSRPTDWLFSGVVICCNADSSRWTKEREMRGAFMSVQERIATYLEDMTPNENVELKDFGACRRR